MTSGGFKPFEKDYIVKLIQIGSSPQVGVKINKKSLKPPPR